VQVDPQVSFGLPCNFLFALLINHPYGSASKSTEILFSLQQNEQEEEYQTSLISSVNIDMLDQLSRVCLEFQEVEGKI
jgi:hypothetical protein